MSFTYHEQVLAASSEGVAIGLFHMDDIERGRMVLGPDDDAVSADVVTAGCHHSVARLELEEAFDLVLFQIELFICYHHKYYLDRVIGFDIWMTESYGPSIMSDNVGDGVGAGGVAEDFAELELGFGGIDFVEDEATLHVVEESVMVAALLDGHNVVVADWEVWVTSGLVVDLDVASLVLHDHDDFPVVEGVSEAISQEHHQWHTLTELVRSWSRSWCPDARKFVQHPVFRSKYSLQVLFWSSSLLCDRRRLTIPLGDLAYKTYNT